MKHSARLMIAAAAAAALCSFANAAQTNHGGEGTLPWFPLGLSLLTPPVQLPATDHSVFGAMINIGYGQMTDVAVLDIGLVNNVTRSMAGLEIGAVNIADTCFGAQAGAFNYAGTVCGVQLGLVNVTGRLHGLQLGVLNFSSRGGALIFPLFNLGF